MKLMSILDLEEVEQARRKKHVWATRGNPRKVLMRKLDFTAALDNLHRSVPRSEQAISIRIGAVSDK